MIARLSIALVIMTIFTSLCIAGENPTPPTYDEVKATITKCLQSEVPISWVGNLMGGKNAVVKEVEVVKVGIYNQQYLYWPMKVRVVGVCKVNDPFNQNKTVSFNKVGDFKFFKDDYGEWKAELAGNGMFQ